jgi:hypothetical protein
VSTTPSSAARSLLPASVSVSALTDEGATAEALAAFFKLVDTFMTVLNSPAMLAARQRADVQALVNRQDADLAAARKTGDTTKLSEDASG